MNTAVGVAPNTFVYGSNAVMFVPSRATSREWLVGTSWRQTTSGFSPMISGICVSKERLFMFKETIEKGDAEYANLLPYMMVRLQDRARKELQWNRLEQNTLSKFVPLRDS